MGVQFWRVPQTGEEGAAGDEDQATVSQCLNRGRPWQSVNHCEFSYNRSRSEDRENSLSALIRRYADLKDALFEPIASIAFVADLERSEERRVGKACTARRFRDQWTGNSSG